MGEDVGGLGVYCESEGEGRRPRHLDALQVLHIVLIEGEEVRSALLGFSCGGEMEAIEETLLLGDCSVDEVLSGQFCALLCDGVIVRDVD